METVNQEVNPALVEDTWAHDEEEATTSRTVRSVFFFTLFIMKRAKPTHAAKLCLGISCISYSSHYEKKQIYRRVLSVIPVRGVTLFSRRPRVKCGCPKKKSRSENHLLRKECLAHDLKFSSFFFFLLYIQIELLEEHYWPWDLSHTIWLYSFTAHFEVYCAVLVTWLQSPLWYVFSCNINAQTADPRDYIPREL